MQYSLIIPAWNEAQFLPHTLRATKAVMLEVARESVHEGELIVVDNNSTDDTAAIARELGARVVFEPVNQIARARNAGAEASKSKDALVFLDADSMCSTALLLYALDKLQSGTCVGGGSSIAPDRVIEGNAKRGLDLWNQLSRRAKLAAGCFVFCRRDAFVDTGGFNTRVYAGEEIYLSRALKKWGKRHSMFFEIVNVSPVVTSVRKLDWYSPSQITLQALVVLIPGALYSKRLCKSWYEPRGREKH